MSKSPNIAAWVIWIAVAAILILVALAVGSGGFEIVYVSGDGQLPPMPVGPKIIFSSNEAALDFETCWVAIGWNPVYFDWEVGE